MSYFDNFINANSAYVALHGTSHLPIKPKTEVAVITCMDARLHVAPALGLALGDAHILRNAGGRVTEDTIRSLVISEQLLGTHEIVVLHHTDCGMLTFKNDELADLVESKLNQNVHDHDFRPFDDLETSVREDVNLLRDSPLIPDDIIISGAIYDVDSGRISAVEC
ncbi:beta-class carbonic anhydrase [Streptococcus dentasini]